MTRLDFHGVSIAFGGQDLLVGSALIFPPSVQSRLFAAPTRAGSNAPDVKMRMRGSKQAARSQRDPGRRSIALTMAPQQRNDRYRKRSGRGASTVCRAPKNIPLCSDLV
jgi:hypothetical protein